MKVKLLKKIRKRYSWYFRKDRYPVLIDHLYRRARIFDFEECCSIRDVKEEDMTKRLETNKLSKDEWCLRVLKDVILKPYGWSMKDVYYKIAVRRFNKRIIKKK